MIFLTFSYILDRVSCELMPGKGSSIKYFCTFSQRFDIWLYISVGLSNTYTCLHINRKKHFLLSHVIVYQSPIPFKLPRSPSYRIPGHVWEFPVLASTLIVMNSQTNRCMGFRASIKLSFCCNDDVLNRLQLPSFLNSRAVKTVGSLINRQGLAINLTQNVFDTNRHTFIITLTVLRN